MAERRFLVSVSKLGLETLDFDSAFDCALS
jgi:hypothetical protein